MSTNRRIIDPSISGDTAVLHVKGENLRYLRSVLRVRIGDSVEILDGRGAVYSGTVQEVDRRYMTLMITGRIVPDTEPDTPVFLIQPLLKGDRMDLVVQKTTELGIRGIFPVVSRYSVVRQTRKVEHWRKVAAQAVRQSGRTVVPDLLQVSRLSDIMASLPTQGIKIVFHRDGEGDIGKIFSSLPEPPAAVYCLTGPEGGLSGEEVKASVNAGFIPVTLGRRTLRAETASIVGVTIVQYLLGEFSRPS